MQIKENISLGPDTRLSPHLQGKISPLYINIGLPSPLGPPSDRDQPQHDPDPPFYWEVAMADLPSQYARKWKPLGIFSISLTPGKLCPGLGLDDQKGQQELRPRGPSAMLPLSSHIKDAFDKFEHDFLASNLPEGKYIKPPPSTAK